MARRTGVASRRRFLTGLTGVSAALAASSTIRAVAPMPVRIASGVTPPSIHNIWLHVAYERGLFRDNGIDVTAFLQLQGGPLALQAIASRQVELAPADPEGLLAAVIAGHPIRGVAAPGARLSYIAAIWKDTGSIAGLRGKTVAISRPGAISQYLWYPLLDRAGVARNSVQWLAVGGGFERMLALTANRVQGTLLNVDFAIEAESDPHIAIAQSVADILPNYPVELAVLRKDLIDANPAVATAITRSIVQACRYIVRNKVGTIEIARKYSPGMSADVLGRAYDELMRIQGFGVNGGMTEANLTVAHDLALQNRQIDRPVALDQWVDLRCQARALDSLGPFTA